MQDHIAHGLLASQRSGTTLLMRALGEAAEFRQVAEAVKDWEANHRRLGGACVFCGQASACEEGCPAPLARAALAATPKPTPRGRVA